MNRTRFLTAAVLSFLLTSALLAACVAPAPLVAPPAPIVVPPRPSPTPTPVPVPPKDEGTVSEWPVVEAILARYNAGERWTRAEMDKALGKPFQKPRTQVDAPKHHVVSWHYKTVGGEVQNLHVHFTDETQDGKVVLMEQA